MRTLKINIPDTIDLDKQEVLLMLASKLYERGKLSLGQAAEVAGLSKRVFMELLGKYGVSVFNYSADELANDIANAKNYHL